LQPRRSTSELCAQNFKAGSFLSKKARGPSAKLMGGRRAGYSLPLSYAARLNFSSSSEWVSDILV